MRYLNARAAVVVVVGTLNARLCRTVLIQRIDFTNARAVGFNQAQTMKYLCKVAVARLRNTTANILRRQAGQQSAD